MLCHILIMAMYHATAPCSAHVLAQARPTMSYIPLVYSIAISLGNWSCMSKKGGTGGGGLVHPESENSMAMYGLAVKIPQ